MQKRNYAEYNPLAQVGSVEVMHNKRVFGNGFADLKMALYFGMANLQEALLTLPFGIMENRTI